MDKPKAFITKESGNYNVFRTDKDENKWWLSCKDKRDAERVCKLENDKISRGE